MMLLSTASFYLLQYGLSGSLEDLDDEQKEMLREGFAGDPSWSSKVTKGLGMTMC